MSQERWCEPWFVGGLGNQTYIYASDKGHIAWVDTENYTRAEDEIIARRICDLVSFFEDVPTERFRGNITVIPRLFLSWLKGDDDAAAIAADWVPDHRQAESVPGYVSRARLLELLGECRSKLRDLQARYGSLACDTFLMTDLDAVLGK